MFLWNEQVYIEPYNSTVLEPLVHELQAASRQEVVQEKGRKSQLFAKKT